MRPHLRPQRQQLTVIQQPNMVALIFQYWKLVPYEKYILSEIYGSDFQSEPISFWAIYTFYMLQACSFDLLKET